MILHYNMHITKANTMTKYKFNFDVTANIDVATVIEMIKTVLEEQTGRKVKSVDFDLSVKKTWQTNEHYAVCNGVKVRFE